MVSWKIVRLKTHCNDRGLQNESEFIEEVMLSIQREDKILRGAIKAELNEKSVNQNNTGLKMSLGVQHGQVTIQNPKDVFFISLQFGYEFRSFSNHIEEEFLTNSKSNYPVFTETSTEPSLRLQLRALVSFLFFSRTWSREVVIGQLKIGCLKRLLKTFSSFLHAASNERVNS